MESKGEELIKFVDEEIRDGTFRGIYIPYVSSRFKNDSTFGEYQKYSETRRRLYIILINSLDILKNVIQIVTLFIECGLDYENHTFVECKNYFVFQLLSAILINLLFIVFAQFNYIKVNLSFLAFLTWGFIFLQGLTDIVQLEIKWAATSSFLNTCFIISVTYAFMPLALSILVFLSVLALLSHISCTFILYSIQLDVPISRAIILEIVADVIFLIGLNLVGFYVRFLSDRIDQKAFLETQRYVTVLDKLKKFADKQKNLLLSVIPSFIAQDLFQNLSDSNALDSSNSPVNDEEEDINNSKLYDFHDVSILFTDVMGFTELASKCSPEKLVEILNELFENFDSLAAENNCLRIKLLGDCYYCICGVPLPRSDHAISSVNLGLNMIHAIQQVRKDYKVELNMRIGIHSGSVLCGIVGKIKWQFDIWSHDVKTANHMESSGEPGRVHISESTLKYLGDIYSVEAVKEVQSEFLRKHNVKTYLVIENSTQSLNAMKSQQSCQLEMDEIKNQEYYHKRRHALGSQVVAKDIEKFYRMSVHFKDNRLKFKYTSGEEDETFISNFFCVLTFWIFSETSFQIFAQFEWLRTILYLLAKLMVLGALLVLLQVKRSQITKSYIHRSMFVVAVLFTMVVSDFNGNENLAKRLISSSIFFILAVDCFSQLKMSLKAFLTVVIALLFAILIINPFHWDFGDAHLNWMEKQELCTSILCFLVIFAFHFNLIAKTSRFLFFRKKQLEDQIKEVTVIKQQNYQLLANILPEQVANHFLQLESIPEEYSKELYAYKWPYVSVLFATIPNFKSCYDSNMETTKYNVQLLHKTIGTFDGVLEQERFLQVEKIKNVGSTYMCCAGLGITEEKEGHKQLCMLVEFALELKRELNILNRFNSEEGQEDLHLRIGISFGPVVAGVIGKGKPCFDIWGNTVNEAARMDTTGKKDFIHVPKSTATILQDNNFDAKCQGLTFVKGKGEMETYNVLGKKRTRFFGHIGKQSFADVVIDVVKINRQQQQLWKKALNRVFAGNPDFEKQDSFQKI